jgi:hypothetical protein
VAQIGDLGMANPVLRVAVTAINLGSLHSQINMPLSIIHFSSLPNAPKEAMGSKKPWGQV